ncbi:MAG TPA: hypothetical protein VGG39_21995 [Polyangiaceae bacterium]
MVKPLRDGQGAVTLWFPGGDIVAARVTGHVGADLVGRTFAEIDRYAATDVHPGRGFIDLSAMTTFDWEARLAFLRWNVANRLKATRVDLLVESWIVRLALGALATILGDRMVAHEDRTSFEAAYAAALDGLRDARSSAHA